jgi:hypothetical protein
MLDFLTLLIYVLSAALLLFNLTALGLKHVATRAIRQRPLKSYSTRFWYIRGLRAANAVAGFQDEDYPSYYPIILPAVVMSAEDTVHYALGENATSAEMGTMFPSGGGFVYLGPERRPFGIALYHQLCEVSVLQCIVARALTGYRHCMSMIAIAYRNTSGRNLSVHTEHCFDYIRQAILCEADITLEPVNEDGSIQIGSPRVCRDWGHVRNMIEDNHKR